MYNLYRYLHSVADPADPDPHQFAGSGSASICRAGSALVHSTGYIDDRKTDA
jgi:hypothetical protein